MDRTDKEGGATISQSPRFFRRKPGTQINNESASSIQGKVVLGEVEEKLKSMRQKRLDRLSTFVAEQSKLSDERSNNGKEVSEMEDAIISIKQTKEEKKYNSQPTIEEHVSNSKGNTVFEEIVKDKSSRPRTPKLFRKFSNESVDKSKSLQKTSSTMKFINKFNCTTTESVSSSIEDLTSENGNKNSIPDLSFNREDIERDNWNKHDAYKSNLQKDSHPMTANKSDVTESILDNYNPLLSPVGKQRKGVYLYDRECKFLENEKSNAMTTFTKYDTTAQTKDSKEQLSRLERTNLNIPQEQKLNENCEVSSDKKVNVYDLTPVTITVEVKPRNSYENKSDIQKPPSIMTTFKRCSLGDILDDKIVNPFNLHRISADESMYGDRKNNQAISKTEVMKDIAQVCESSKVNNTDKVPSQKNVVVEKKESNEKHFLTPPKSPMPLPRRGYNMEVASTNEDNGNTFKYFGMIGADKIQQNKTRKHLEFAEYQNKMKPYQMHSSDPPRSPLPLPRRFTTEERILKKFQRNWDNLKEIIENDSDVDSDEIEDLKKTFEEVHELVIEYKEALKKIEEKSTDRDNYGKLLAEVKEQVKDVAKEITVFKGLKRDLRYRELHIELSNCMFEVNKIKCNKNDFLKEKNVITKDIENYTSILENKVTKNQNLLLEVLEAQVSSIGTNIFNITKV